jgi:peptide-methionine (S)-S-oxide reductase
MIDHTKTTFLAGGCFWGVQELFRTLEGVVETRVGYSGGRNENPTYENHPGHAEVVAITYDPTKISFRGLLEFFFRMHNPTTVNQQGNDRGDSYRSAIFYQNEEEYQEAKNVIAFVNTSGRWAKPIVTTLEPFKKFWPAEEYHQDYLKKNPGGYTCHQIYFDDYE